ncbi:MAG: nuclear transport factor 2 family protein [Candidatus Solibacter usitatus]|nr:nuclear transport factor 2 family protein [Candidatus Solibacter usitatus]
MRFLPVVLFAAVLAGCGDAPKTENAAADLKPHMQKVYAAWSTLDAAKPAPFYAKDAGLVFFDLAPFSYKGWSAYEEGFRKAAAEWKAIKIELGPDFQASRRGDVAWVIYTLNFDIAPKSGEHMKGSARGTDVLEKRGDNWLIVHEHVSVPMMEPEKKAPPKPAAKPKTAKKSRRK